MNARTLNASEYLFIRWMAENHPGLLAAAENQVRQQGQLSGLTDALNSILGAVNRGIDTYVKGKESVALVKLNVQRAKQGLPPLTEAGDAYRVSAEDLKNRSMPMMTPAKWVGLGLLGLWLLTRE